MDFDESNAVKAERVTLLNEYRDREKGPITGRYDGGNDVIRLRKSKMPSWEVSSVVISVSSGLVCAGRVIGVDGRQKGMAKYVLLEINNDL